MIFSAQNEVMYVDDNLMTKKKVSSWRTIKLPNDLNELDHFLRTGKSKTTDQKVRSSNLLGRANEILGFLIS